MPSRRCARPREHGNGIIEIPRGSIQVRGLSAVRRSLRRAIAKLNIAASDTIQAQSNPLAGLDPEEILMPARSRPLRRALAKTPLPDTSRPKSR
jgi:hypothetical protein